MERGLLSLVVVLVVVVSVLSAAEGARSSTPDLLDCDAGVETEVKEGPTQVIPAITPKDKVYVSSFVKAESGFEGVLLDVVEGGDNDTHRTAWLPAEDCVSPNGTWWGSVMRVAKTTTGVNVIAIVGTCWMECEFNIGEPDLMSISVEARGPSKWGRLPPNGCSAIPFLPLWNYKRVFGCQDPSPSTATIIIVLAGVLMVMLVVVLVVVVWWKRRSVTSLPRQDKNPGKDYNCDELQDLSTRRVAAPQPSQDSEQPVYDDVLPAGGVWPSAPVYLNVHAAGGGASPLGHLQAAGKHQDEDYDEDHIYDEIVPHP